MSEEQSSQQQLNHIEIGTQMQLFFSDISSPGSPFFLPAGTKIFRKLQGFLRRYYDTNGYQEVITPNLFQRSLWETSGHWEKYQENMFLIQKPKHGESKQDEGNDEQSYSKTENDTEIHTDYSIKAMNCPSHCLIFKHLKPTYKQLPLRLADFGVLHRNELSGSLRGLTRVRKFQQDDAHIFCSLDQVEGEINELLRFIDHVYRKAFGFNYQMEVSTRPEKYIGSLENWNRGEEILKKSVKQFCPDQEVTVNEGDGAFYGPKIDLSIKDSMDRWHQCGTIQLDFNLPQRFDLKYPDENQEAIQPVIIHRAILGSIERFMAILLEHTQGFLPFWLSPRQLYVIPITSKQAEYAKQVADRFLSKYQVELDLSSEALNNKIKRGSRWRYNYLLIVGKREEAKGQVSVRKQDGSQEVMSLEDLDSFLRSQDEKF